MRQSATREGLTADLFEERRVLGVVNDIADQAVADYLGINRTDARCLDIIGRLGGVSAGRLARESGLSTGAVTTVLDRLERAGYARRTSDPGDRRRGARRADPGGARGQRGRSTGRSSRPRRRSSAATPRRSSRCCATTTAAAARSLEAHAERVRSLLRRRQEDGEAAS